MAFLKASVAEPIGQLAIRRASSTASGCRAMTASRTRAGPSGRVRPCSQLRNVAGWQPNRAAALPLSIDPVIEIRSARKSGHGSKFGRKMEAAIAPLVAVQ